MQDLSGAQFGSFDKQPKRVQGTYLHVSRVGLYRRPDFERAAQVALAQETIARALDVSIADLRSPTRQRAPVALARQVAMYLTHVAFGFSLSAVGRHFGRDRTTAAHACRRIEDRRDDRDFDLLLDHLEHALRGVSRACDMQ